MDQQAAVRVFTEIFLADLELDRVRSLDEYRALFPGHADSISTKFERLTMDHATPRAFDAASDGGVFIGRYRLEKLLGRGGQGEVHLAFDANLKRHVALKTLHAFDSDDARRALLREASIIAGLDHPNLCAVHEVGSADGIDFVAMRYVKGSVAGAALGGTARVACSRTRRPAEELADRPSNGSRPAPVRCMPRTRRGSSIVT
jgi:hypothetical protein